MTPRGLFGERFELVKALLSEFIREVTIPWAVELARTQTRSVSKVPGVISAIEAKRVFAGSPPTDSKDPVVPDTLQNRSVRVFQSEPKRLARSVAMEPSVPKDAMEAPLVKLDAEPSLTR